MSDISTVFVHPIAKYVATGSSQFMARFTKSVILAIKSQASMVFFLNFHYAGPAPATTDTANRGSLVILR